MRNAVVVAMSIVCTSCSVIVVPLDAGPTGGGGAIGGGATGGGGADAGGGGPIASCSVYTPCDSLTRRVDKTYLNIMLLLDESSSMQYNYKWQAVKVAVQTFLVAPTSSGLRVGLQYFPTRNPSECSIDYYETPAVALGELPTNEAPLRTSLEAQAIPTNSGTPMLPALLGTLNYTRDYIRAATSGNHRGIVVLATDGLPDTSCIDGTFSVPNTIENVALVAREAYNNGQDGGIRTFVIGVGTALAELDTVAEAGGTGKSLVVDVGVTADKNAFLDALEGIRRSASGCDFPVLPATVSLDSSRANVTFTNDDGGVVCINQLRGGLGECTDESGESVDGWYFTNPINGYVTADGGRVDAGDPTADNVLRLCPKTCDFISGGVTGSMKTEFSCRPQ